MIKGADSDGGLSPAAEVEGARRRKMRYTGLVHATRPLRPTLRIIPTRRWPRSATPAPCFRLNAEWRGGGSVCGGVYVGNPASAAATPRDGPGCRAEADGCVQRGAAVGASGGVGHTGPARPAVSDWNTGRTASGLKPAGRGRAERHSGRCTHSQSDTVEKSRVVRDQGCQLGRRPGRRPPSPSPPLPPSAPLCQPSSRRTTLSAPQPTSKWPAGPLPPEQDAISRPTPALAAHAAHHSDAAAAVVAAAVGGAPGRTAAQAGRDRPHPARARLNTEWSGG